MVLEGVAPVVAIGSDFKADLRTQLLHPTSFEVILRIRPNVANPLRRINCVMTYEARQQ
jgi:hypothetical protein